MVARMFLLKTRERRQSQKASANQEGERGGGHSAQKNSFDGESRPSCPGQQREKASELNLWFVIFAENSREAFDNQILSQTLTLVRGDSYTG